MNEIVLAAILVYSHGAVAFTTVLAVENSDRVDAEWWPLAFITVWPLSLVLAGVIRLTSDVNTRLRQWAEPDDIRTFNEGEEYISPLREIVYVTTLGIHRGFNEVWGSGSRLDPRSYVSVWNTALQNRGERYDASEYNSVRCIITGHDHRFHAPIVLDENGERRQCVFHECERCGHAPSLGLHDYQAYQEMCDNE